VKNCIVNLDRRTGFLKGYAMLEYETSEEAKAAIKALNGSKLADKVIKVDWAFKKPPK
jgi:RNA-binding protein 8A